MAAQEEKFEEVTRGFEITFFANGKILVEQKYRQDYGHTTSGPYYNSHFFPSKEEALAHISEIWGE